MLCDAGYEIFVDRDGKSNAYPFGSRTFELPELKMLVDAVSSSRFISAEKSDVRIGSEDRHYLVGYSDTRDALTPFRVDRMTVPEILEEGAVENTAFNVADFTNKVIQMFSGTKQTVTLRCENDTMRSVIDKFGDNIRVNIMDDEHFTAQVQVQASQTFYGWVFTFAGEIEAMEPDNVQNEYLAMEKKVIGQR